MEFLMLLLGSIIGMSFGTFIYDCLQRKDMDESYLQGFIAFHKKDLKKIKEMDKELLKKYEIELGE